MTEAERSRLQKVGDFYVMFMVVFMPALIGGIACIYVLLNPAHWNWILFISGTFGIGWTGCLLATRIMGD